MDRVSSEVRSRMMSSVKPQSGIEAIPHWLRGLYLRRHPKGVFGSPDFGNKAKRIAVFIDGCFWHGCPVHYREPQSNRSYWLPKLVRNADRDIEVNEELSRQGWFVHRVWECQMRVTVVALVNVENKSKGVMGGTPEPEQPDGIPLWMRG